MKFTVIIILVAIVSFVHGFYVPKLVFSDCFILQLIYSILSGIAIGSLGAHIYESLED